MTELANVLRGIPAPKDYWDESSAGLGRARRPRLRSNLLGSDRAVANEGGGNTSAKGTAVDHAGRETRVLWVKGSGTDLATITGAGFAALRLDEVLPLRSGRRWATSDGRLPAPLGTQPAQPRPSIETLLHAFIPAAHIDHTHPDAVIALTSPPKGAASSRTSSATRLSGSTTSAPGSTCRGGSPSCSTRIRRHAPSCSSATGSSPGATPQACYQATHEFVRRPGRSTAAGRASASAAGR